MDITFLKRFFKALVAPYPLPKLNINDKLYDIKKYKIIARDYYCHLGRVVNIDEEGVWIKILGGLLVITEICKTGENLNIDSRSVLKLGYRLAN